MLRLTIWLITCCLAPPPRHTHTHTHYIVLKFSNASGHIVSTFQSPFWINASLNESLCCHGNISPRNVQQAMRSSLYIVGTLLVWVPPTVGNKSVFCHYAVRLCLLEGFTASLTLCSYELHISVFLASLQKKSSLLETGLNVFHQVSLSEEAQTGRPSARGRHWITGKLTLFMWPALQSQLICFSFNIRAGWWR